MSKKVYGESIEYHSRAHFMCAWKNVLVALFSIAMLLSSLSFEKDDGGKAFVVFFLVVLLLAITQAFMKLTLFGCTLTDKRVYGKAGLLSTKTLSVPLSQISSVELKQGVFGKIFGYGNICIQTVTATIVFRYMKDAESMQNAIISKMHA